VKEQKKQTRNCTQQIFPDVMSGSEMILELFFNLSSAFEFRHILCQMNQRVTLSDVFLNIIAT